MENENIIYINDNTIFKKNVEINNCITVDGGMVIEGDLNTNNQNIFGLLSVHGNIYSNGDLYISSNKNDNYTYIKNDGSLECQSINMKNKILFGNKDYTIYQENNSIILNTTNEILKMDKFQNIGIIKNKAVYDDLALRDFENKINSFQKNLSWSRLDLIEIFSSILPNFDHYETGKYLDEKM